MHLISLIEMRTEKMNLSTLSALVHYVLALIIEILGWKLKIVINR